MCVENRRRAGGFTLLEVVVATAIAGLALVGLFEAGGGGLVAANTAARAEEAVQRAQSHLAAIGRDAALVGGVSSGSDGGGYRWQLRVAPLATQEMPSRNRLAPNKMTLFKVEVAVSWRSGRHERRVVLRTLRLGTGAGGV